MAALAGTDLRGASTQATCARLAGQMAVGRTTMKVFLNYSHADAELAARVTEALQQRGLQVWTPDRNLLPGDNWAAELGRALEESNAMVVLLTPRSPDPDMKRNIGYALGAKNYSNRLIPVVVGDPAQVRADLVPWIVRRMRRIELDENERIEPQVQPIVDAIRYA